MKTKEYFEGLIDGIIEVLLIEDVYVEEEKELEWFLNFNENTKVVSVFLQCIEAYTEAKFKGDWLQPPDDDEPVYYSDLVVFSEKTKTLEIIDKIKKALQIISDLDSLSEDRYF